MKLDFIVFTDTYFHTRQYPPDASYPEISLPFTGNRSGTFRQSISGNHVDSHGMYKLLHLFRYGCPGSGEEITVFNPDGFLQKAVDGPFIEFISHVQHGRRSLSIHQVRDIMLPAYPQRIQHQSLFQPGGLIDFFLHTGIYLFPETRHTAHGRRTDFLDGFLDILRFQVDAQHTSPVQAIESPSPFKNMRERQKIHHHIIFSQFRETRVMPFESSLIIGMMQHHSLGIARSAGSI